jgi:NTE family protein
MPSVIDRGLQVSTRRDAARRSAGARSGLRRAGTLHAWTAAVCAALSACAVTLDNAPLNRPDSVSEAPPAPESASTGENFIGLSFSGGGLRAAAFSFGVLQALHDMEPPGGDGPAVATVSAGSVAGQAVTPTPAVEDLLPDVGIISSVSGGSLAAAYYGLHGEPMLHDFRRNVLLLDMERGMRISGLSPNNIARMLVGGLNDRSNLGDVLERKVFDGATFGDLDRRGKPQVWINATDLFNHTSFAFTPTFFSAICSDLPSFSVAEAVSASIAVPVVFAPVLLRTFPDHCTEPLPPWVAKALAQPGDSKLLNAEALAMTHYREPKVMNFVKLVDGGVSDNYGLSSLLIGRLASTTTYGPLTPRNAVQLRRMLFLVVDSGRSPSGQWAVTALGPSGFESATASIDTAIDAAARTSFDAFKQMLADWQADIIRYRCSLSPVEVARLRAEPPTGGGAPRAPAAPWDCHDIRMDVGLISFSDLDTDRQALLNAIPTRLTLPREQIDAAIEGGRDAALRNQALRRYLQSRRAPSLPAQR